MNLKRYIHCLTLLLPLLGGLIVNDVWAAGTTNTWEGDDAGDPTNWSVGANWSTGNVPVSGTHNVVIPTGLANYPVLTANSACRTITSMGDGSSIGGNFALTPSANTSIAVTGEATISCNLAGAITYTQTGTGTLILAGNNTFTSTLTISAGTLKLGANGGGTNGPLGTTAAGTTIRNGATFDLNGFTLGTTEALSIRGTGVSNAGALTNTGGNASYSGNITLAAAATIVATTSGDLTVSGNIASNQALTLRGAGNGELTGVRSSANSIVKNDAGTWTLSGANTYSGVTTISAGTLKLNNTTALGTSSATTVTSGAVLDLNGITLSTARPLTLNGTGISGSGALTNTGGNASFSGAITLGTASTIAATTSGDLTLSGNMSGNFALTLSGAGVGTYSGVRSGSGALIKDDAGTWTLSGTNTYTGSTTATAGILRANANVITSTAGAFGNNAGNLFLNGGTIQSNTATFSRPITIQATNSGLDAFGSARTISSTINLATVGTFNVNIGANTVTSEDGQDLTLSGVISNSSGTLGLSKVGSSLAILSGTNTYSGNTIISEGTLQLNNTAALGATTNGTSITSGAVLDLNGVNYTTAEALTINGTGISSGGAFINSNATGATFGGLLTLGSASSIVGGTGTITISNAGTITGATFGLTLGGNAGGTLASILGTTSGTLTKEDAGTWTLSGANTYTGTTTVDAGTLRAGTTTSAFGSGSAVIMANTSGAILDLDGNSNTIGSLTGGGATGGNVTLGSATLTIGTDNTSPAAYAGVISGSGLITKSGTGTLILSGTNTYTGATNVTDGVLNIRDAQATGTTAGGVTVSSGAALELEGGIAVGAEALTISGTGFSGGGALRNISSNNTWGGTVTLQGANNRINSDAGTLTLNATNAITSSDLLVRLGGAGNIDVSGTITIGSASLIKSGSGTVTLSGANTYTGGTTLNGGTLNINSSSALGASGTFTISDGTAIDNTSGADITTNNYTLAIDGNIAYTGGVPRNLNLGTGTVTLTNNPAITTTAGTLTIGGVINDNTQNITKLGIGTLSFGSQAVTLNNVTISAGTLVSTSNTLGIAGDFSNSGTFTHNSGTVDFNKAGPQNIGTATFNNLTVSNSGTKTATGNLLVDGALTVAGGVILDMTSSFTLLGALSTISNSGTIRTSVPTTTSSTPLASGKTWNGLVNYAATTGLQTVVSGTYADLTISNTSAANSMSGNVTIGGVFTMSGGKLVVGSNTLALNGTLSGMTASSSLTANASSSVSIGGSGALGTHLFFDQTTPGTTNKLIDFTYNRSGATGVNAITLGNSLQVTGTVTPTAGELATGGNLTLISTAGGTARIANGGCTSCSYITGNVNIQRFIPSVARRWRFLGSTVQSTTLADWKAETYVTGAGGASNGFDATGSNAASVFWYDETLTTGDLNTGWTAATNITNSIPPGKGFRLFVRGDRSNSGRLDGTVTDQNAVTLDLVGVPNQGNISLPVSFTSSGTTGNDGWCLVANPYASPYDWASFYTADSNTASCFKIDPTVWVLDAQNGGYRSYNAKTPGGNLTGGIIPAGASFWVKAYAASPSLVFKEQYKVATNPVAVFKTNEGEGFIIQLYYDSITWDGLTVKYKDGSTTNSDAYDIRKLTGTVTVSAYGADNVQLALSCRPLSNSVDTIKLNVGGAVGTYQLKFSNIDMIAVAENVLLFDTYTSTITDLKSTGAYTFNIVSGVAASQGLNRFYIVVGNNGSLPVKLLQFKATKIENKHVQLSWATAQEINSKLFEVERSVDGKQYVSIASVAAAGNTHNLVNYKVVDEIPLRTNYYRLKQVDLDGTISYSRVEYMLMDELSTAGVKMYPIPAHETLTIEYVQPIISIAIFDVSGNKLNEQTCNGAKITMDVSNLKTGIYIVEFTDESGEVYREKFSKK